MKGEWLAFSPDNEHGGYQMGISACESSWTFQQMEIAFIKLPGLWCDQGAGIYLYSFTLRVSLPFLCAFVSCAELYGAIL